jgi:hypothetical protein
MKDNKDVIPEGVMTTVSLELHGADRARVIAAQAQAAEQQLAPVLKVMREAGLIADGYRAGLVDQVPAVGLSPRGVSPAVQESLIAARDLIRVRIDVTAVPDTLIGLSHAVICLQGDDGVGSVSNDVLGRIGWELC